MPAWKPDERVIPGFESIEQRARAAEWVKSFMRTRPFYVLESRLIDNRSAQIYMPGCNVHGLIHFVSTATEFILLLL